MTTFTGEVGVIRNYRFVDDSKKKRGPWVTNGDGYMLGEIDVDMPAQVSAERVRNYVLPNPLGTAIRVAMYGYAGAMRTEGRGDEWTIVRPLAMDRAWFHATMQRRAMVDWVHGRG